MPEKEPLEEILKRRRDSVQEEIKEKEPLEELLNPENTGNRYIKVADASSKIIKTENLKNKEPVAGSDSQSEPSYTKTRKRYISDIAFLIDERIAQKTETKSAKETEIPQPKSIQDQKYEIKPAEGTDIYQPELKETVQTQKLEIKSSTEEAGISQLETEEIIEAKPKKRYSSLVDKYYPSDYKGGFLKRAANKLKIPALIGAGAASVGGALYITYSESSTIQYYGLSFLLGALSAMLPKIAIQRALKGESKENKLERMLGLGGGIAGAMVYHFYIK